MKIVLIGPEDAWERFAEKALQAAGWDTVWIPADALHDLQPRCLSGRDLVVLSPKEGQRPSEALRRLFRLGPLRVVVVDGRYDFVRAGDAMRGCAVGYDAKPWNRDELLQLVGNYLDADPPDPSTLDRRYDLWRVSA